MTIKILLISTALLALSVFIVTLDRFSSLLTPIAIYISVATIRHTVALNFPSHSLQKSLLDSITPAFLITWLLPRFLPVNYQDLGAMGQLSFAAFSILILAILYLLFARITEDH